jgi:hypothetical protein
LLKMERETGLEPEAIRFNWFYCVLSGFFSWRLVPHLLPCFSLSRRLVITRLSRRARFRPENGSRLEETGRAQMNPYNRSLIRSSNFHAFPLGALMPKAGTETDSFFYRRRHASLAGKRDAQGQIQSLSLGASGCSASHGFDAWGRRRRLIFFATEGDTPRLQKTGRMRR